jgi:predicted ATPase/class 3 adenylate cyclase
MQQIADWLEKLGMSEYAQRFAENKIDVSVLRHLTDQDLKDIGVPLGHRRKLLAAIEELAGAARAKPAPTAGEEPKPEDAAERRQVTVMFSDLVGSTALSARMDPEDLREVISAYQKCVADTVGRFGGFIAKYMGDGVLVYFGYPQAHEDDAERAVRAGLELVTTVGGLKTHAPLQTRVGIATGLVVVGDLIGSGASREQGIVGETPNVAARLQGIAEPNCVVIAESTRKLLGNLFELHDLGAQDLKGIGGSVRAWAALRQATVESRFDALHISGLTDLVGREEELEILLRRWSKAKSGEGQVVLLSGEPGIGKSRLTAALLERLTTEPHTRIRNFCSPQHTDSAFYPVIDQMERAAGLTFDDTLTVKLDKLDAMLAQTSTSPQDAALVVELLSLTNDGRFPRLELTPQQRRQRTLEVLVSQIVALSHQNPLLMIFEDAQWADPTSLELFGRIVDKIPRLRVLLIVTFRPEFEPPWIGWHHVTALMLNRLGEREIGALIDHVTGNSALPESIRQDIIERTDGIPLFVEEMTKAVLEAESEGEAGKTAAAVPSAALAVPASLHASLMARLDRLGAAKELAQIGAVIGRSFPYLLLAAVAHNTETELRSALDRLVLAGLLFRQGLPPQATYLFKHALVQDAAYGTLLRGQRRALHAHIAATLESQFAEIAEAQPELLARHYTEAGLIPKAASWWGKAGQRSLARSALNEAVEQLSRAIAQLQTLPPNSTIRNEHIKLQVSLIPALINVRGHAAPETREATQRARFLIEQSEARGEHPDDPLLLFTVLYSSWVAKLVEFNGGACRDLAAQFLALAKKDGTAAPLIVGHRMAGMSLSGTGALTRARAHYDKALALYNPAEHRRLATRFGQDLRVQNLQQRSLTAWMLGYPNAAQADARQALADARQISQASTLMVVLCITGMTHVLCGSFSAADTQSEEVIQLAKEKLSPIWRAFGMINKGCALRLCDRNAEAIQMITAGIAAYRATRATAYLPYFLSQLSLAYARVGRLDEASKCIIEATSTIEKARERWWEAEANRAAGEIALLSINPDAAKAEAHFERALTVARRQQAKSWELRAAMSMARLWRDQGKRNEAHEFLALVYGWFNEGLDTLDLQQAKTLMDELDACRSRA